jgi:hypothetical protein
VLWRENQHLRGSTIPGTTQLTDTARLSVPPSSPRIAAFWTVGLPTLARNPYRPIWRHYIEILGFACRWQMVWRPHQPLN